MMSGSSSMMSRGGAERDDDDRKAPLIDFLLPLSLSLSLSLSLEIDAFMFAIPACEVMAVDSPTHQWHVTTCIRAHAYFLNYAAHTSRVPDAVEKAVRVWATFSDQYLTGCHGYRYKFYKLTN